MTGKIIKGISGFYYVYVAGAGIYECKAKGIFRNKKIRPLVGDDVRIAVIDEAEKTGNVEEILPRKSELIRPAVANVDMALVIFAAARPEPNFNLLDRMLCMMEYQGLPAAICFNKSDLVTEEERKKFMDIYAPAGYRILFTSAEKGENIGELREALSGRTATVAGPSGVGKSSLINRLQDNIHMETGAISEKIERGKHTTRHSQIIPLSDDTYIVDTPGFGSMDLPGFDKEELWKCYPEFAAHEPGCRFIGCSHIMEPGCGVKEAVERGEISRIRYDNYVLLYDEIKNHKKY
jgi:ribosome biogenesis GTPase